MDLLEKEWYIEAPWGRICIIAWGNCYDPPVLLCHGILDSAACFRPLVRMLPQNYYYIAMELPGNGRSDWLPMGLPLSVFELVYSVHVVVRHFRWEQFIYIGHSAGCLVGKMYDLCYKGKIRMVVELDPWINMLHVKPKQFAQWYHKSFRKYFENYEFNNTPRELMKVQKREEALQRLIDSRGLLMENAEATLERMAVPVGDGLVRFTYDQRMKAVVIAPYNKEQVIKLYTDIRTPTLTILADNSKDSAICIPLLLKEDSYPNGNVRVRRVSGTHDVHFISPETLAPLVAQFLLYGLKGLDDKAKI